MEEMGLKANLDEIFNFTYKEPLDNNLTEHELDHVFFGITDDRPLENPNEVSDWKYISFNYLLADVEKQPENYTVWFRKIYKRVHEYALLNK